MHINIYNSIKVYFLDSELINTIEDAKKETADKNTSSHLDTHIKKVLKETSTSLTRLMSIPRESGNPNRPAVP